MFYIVGTPIGNIEDISFRAVKILTMSDVILCEDTRTFNFFYQRVQNLINIYPKKHQKIISYYKDKEFEKLPSILAYLKENKDVALVTESGMPTISDPGNILINQLIKIKSPFTIIPGPTAFVNALVLSGLFSGQLLFYGFFPKKISQVYQCIDTMIQIDKICPKISFAFYESPHRINKTLKIINQLIPNADICVCREMTKKFEEIIRAKSSELMNKRFKGEITVVLKIKE